MTSGYFPMGAMIANEKLYEPFRYGTSTPNITTVNPKHYNRFSLTLQPLTLQPLLPYNLF